MDQREAITLLEKSIKRIEELHECETFSAEHTRWLIDTQNVLEDIFGRGSRIYLNFVSIQWSFRGVFTADPWEFDVMLRSKNVETYHRGLESAKGVLEAGIDLIRRRGIDNIYTPRGIG